MACRTYKSSIPYTVRYTILYMNFGERLKVKRKAANLTQEQLGKMVGLKKATISSLELGSSKKPSAENLLPLAKALNVDPNWLITGKGGIHPQALIREPSVAYHVPWPAKLEQVNMALVADIADKIVAATGADADVVQKEIAAAILGHYKGK